MKEEKWLNIPEKDIKQWLGEYILSSIVLNSWNKKKGSPKKIRTDNFVYKDKKDGKAVVYYNVQF